MVLGTMAVLGGHASAWRNRAYCTSNLYRKRKSKKERRSKKVMKRDRLWMWMWRMEKLGMEELHQIESLDTCCTEDGVYRRFTMAMGSSPSACISPAVSTHVLAFTARPASHRHHLQVPQFLTSLGDSSLVVSSFIASRPVHLISFGVAFLWKQSKVLPRILCKAEDTIGSKRRGRRGVSEFSLSLGAISHQCSNSVELRDFL